MTLSPRLPTLHPIPTLPAPRELCVVTGLPAHYRDPLTSLGYADAAAFKALRARLGELQRRHIGLPLEGLAAKLRDSFASNRLLKANASAAPANPLTQQLRGGAAAAGPSTPGAAETPGGPGMHLVNGGLPPGALGAGLVPPPMPFGGPGGIMAPPPPPPPPVHAALAVGGSMQGGGQGAGAGTAGFVGVPPPAPPVPVPFGAGPG